MHLLVIHDDTSLATDFVSLANRRIEPLSIHQLPLNALLSQGLPETWPPHDDVDIVLFAVTTTNRQEDTRISGAELTKIVKNLVRLTRNKKLPLIYVSSSAVFTGEELHYVESDATNNTSDTGKIHRQLEKIVSKHPLSLIIRTGWIFSEAGDNFLTRVIEYAQTDRVISVNSAGKGCPTASVDLARVILAICLQLPLSSSVYGTYHYCSSDAAIGYQFIETALTHAAKYDTKIDPKNIRFEHRESETSPFYFEPVVMDCQKLLETFGIHRKPWRSMIAQTVKSCFEPDPSQAC